MKLKKIILPLLNPIKWIKAGQFKRSQPKHNKANRDLELQLYSKILKNDMLHYGYFDDPNVDALSISIRDVENAQIRYAELIGEQVKDKEGMVLDVGCGMGGLSNILTNNGFIVEALTPDVNQKMHLGRKYPDIICHHAKFENFDSDKKYKTIINSESLQYINLQVAFEKVNKLLDHDGKWIITDYFRLNTLGKSKSGHTHQAFLDMVKKEGWFIEKEVDITQNCLPTLRLVNAYIERFVFPGANFGVEKMKIKSPKLYYMTQNIRDAISKKAEKEFAAVDPIKFANEKKYMLYVLTKN